MRYHSPVMLEESIDGLNIKPNGVYVDLTYGGGGHSQEILNRLKNGKLLVFDQDQDAINNVIEDDRLTFVQHNFRFINNFLTYYNIESVDGIIADLGISSHHIDTPHRGFSFRFDSQMDMRMNIRSGFSAKELINNYSEEQLASIFREYGELKNSKRLAANIVEARQNQYINTIRDFLEAISGCLPIKREHQYLAKVFQALRLEVNKEMKSLKLMLKKAPMRLKDKGRLVIISYHSLEDRLVKNFMKSGNFEGRLNKDLYGNIIRVLKPVNNKVLVPKESEIKTNNRARSAKLRIAEKI